jgi:hypothetical protein
VLKKQAENEGLGLIQIIFTEFPRPPKQHQDNELKIMLAPLIFRSDELPKENLYSPES